MAENRLARELESRETTQRKKPWAPSSLIPDPAPSKGWIDRIFLGILYAPSHP